MKGFKHIPGPKSYPLIGNILGYRAPGVSRDPKNSPQIWKHLNEKYGPLVRLDIPGNGPLVLVFDPFHAEKVYRNEGTMPNRPGFQSLGQVRRSMPEFKGVLGLLPSQGMEWKEFRGKVQQSLLQPRVVNTFNNTVHKISEEFCEHLENFKGEDYTQEFYKWALENIAAMALDRRLNGFGTSEQDTLSRELISLIADMLRGSKKLDVGVRLWQKIPTKTFRKLEKDIEVFNGLTSALIKEAISNAEGSGELETTLLGHLSSRGCDELTISIMATDLIFGGVEQTAHTLAFSLYLLAVNPRVQDQLLRNIKENKNDAQLMRAVVKESMRLFPAAIGNIRLLSGCIELGEFSLDPGTTFVLAHQTMSQNCAYINNPQLFNPQRWVRHSEEREDIHSFLTLPFGWGPRSCIGRRLSEMEVYSCLATIISKFKVGWTGPPLKIKSEIVIFPEGALSFTFTKR